jgi:hypothetical protein
MSNIFFWIYEYTELKTKEDINNCPLITDYWKTENDINPHKEKMIFMEFIWNGQNWRVGKIKKLKMNIYNILKT